MNTTELIGIFFIGVILFNILRLLYIQFLAPYLYYNYVDNLFKAGKWAVVTGSTDGIGKAYAEQLASKGMDIVLISRSKTKLENVSSCIRKRYNVSTKIIQVDFTDKYPKIYNLIEKELHEMDIGVLVNNVGMGPPYPDYFLNYGENRTVYDDILQCNIMSVTRMCQIVLPNMVKKHCGIIINVSSASADLNCPLLTVYGATKVFIEKFSVDLATEYKKSGVIIQCIKPGFVTTNMSRIRKTSWTIPNSEFYVQSALQTVGFQSVTSGYIPHTVWVKCIQIARKISPQFVQNKTMETMLESRFRILNKQNRFKKNK
ncbi:very-long-chain 3-oxoacyl-CoA reductase-B-like [Daktulosphaira vitifoliae]|uniref:very-long-chain 3-oxoacyl-CoA reductase-B-like n=1 Tax=Daktulosphaira vitifoliae TaxID=58002 RepID=UPI0021A9D5ED|nr:very-long-chain 3-oxoacyl-CoA reductase-B-like [Daktulosphaira vitifoliae]